MFLCRSDAARFLRDQPSLARDAAFIVRPYLTELIKLPTNIDPNIDIELYFRRRKCKHVFFIKVAKYHHLSPHLPITVH